MKKPCPGALGAFGVPARRWRTRVDLFDQIEEARRYMDRSPVDAISIAEAAKIAGLSEFHFMRLFKEVVGRPPAEYITGRRLSHAEELLKSSSMTIAEIALECGYLDASAFGRAFKRRHKCAPGQFRTRSRTS
jgi:AraC-like DNA-binding protein